MQVQKVQRTTLTMKEAAEYLGISYWLINQLVRRKEIPCSKVGGKFLFRVQALEEYLSSKEKESIKYYLMESEERRICMNYLGLKQKLIYFQTGKFKYF